jgi:hypothetical protein
LVNSQEGFNAEKFRKLVARFDDTNPNEAENAFRLALDELKRNQLTFTEQLLDRGELECAQEECAEAQAELAELFERCAKREAEAEDFKAINDRLHQHIAELEALAADAREAETPEEETHPTPTPYTFFGEDERDEPNEPAQVEARPWGEFVGLPVWIVAFWCGLVAVVLYYTGSSIAVGHPLATLDDWNLIHWYEFLIVLLVTAGSTYYFHDTINDADDPNIDRFRAILRSPRMMLVAVAGLVMLWAGIRLITWNVGQELPDIALVVATLGMFGGWWLVSGQRHYQNFGGRGVLLNFLLVATLVFVCVLGPIDQKNMTDEARLIAAGVGALLAFPLCSIWLATWIFDDHRRFRWITIAGAFFTLIAALGIYDHLSDYHHRHPSETAKAQTRQIAPLASLKTNRARRLHK